MSPPLLVLVGPPASGKTTVGTAVAEILGSAFRDTDHDIEDEAGTIGRRRLRHHGEPHFRALEEEAVARALAEHDGVLALGGGAVTAPATRGCSSDYGRAGGGRLARRRPRSAARRVGLSRDRPILGVNPRAMLRHMLEARAPLYGEVATMTVFTGGREPEDVVAEVLAALPAR